MEPNPIEDTPESTNAGTRASSSRTRLRQRGKRCHSCRKRWVEYGQRVSDSCPFCGERRVRGLGALLGLVVR